MYQRVIPRDLFNEAKLLKCLGQLSLIILNNVGIAKWRLTIEHDDELYKGFSINNEFGSGDLRCSNVTVCVAGKPIDLYCGLNNREVYPLCFEEEDGGGNVFDDDGKFTVDFVDFLDRMNTPWRSTRRVAIGSTSIPSSGPSSTSWNIWLVWIKTLMR